MKKLIFIALACFFIFESLSGGIGIVVAEEKTRVQHFFTHELVYSPERAYSDSNYIRKCFDRDHLTTREFSAILEELYFRGYILVNIEDAYVFKNGKWEEKEGNLFGDKKPLVLSFDDLTYDTIGRGIVEKIVAKDGEIWDYASCEEVQFTQERDGISILEKFIEKNPDFSYNGARAILCVTGYNGAFGYRVFDGTYLSEQKLEEEKKGLENVVSLLKEKGYTFACHSYSHCNAAYANYSEFQNDLRKWENEIGKFVGETSIYCYPGGNHKAQGANNELLKQKGFNVFLCTGNCLTEKEKFEKGVTYFYRHPLDGTALRLCEEEYSSFFDTRKVYDERRYLPFSYKKGY